MVWANSVEYVDRCHVGGGGHGILVNPVKEATLAACSNESG